MKYGRITCTFNLESSLQGEDMCRLPQLHVLYKRTAVVNKHGHLKVHIYDKRIFSSIFISSQYTWFHFLFAKSLNYLFLGDIHFYNSQYLSYNLLILDVSYAQV